MAANAGNQRPARIADRRATLFGLIIGLIIAATIAARATYTPSGYLSPDSTYYLALARSLDLGHGFMIPNAGHTPAQLEHFAIWPVGYPVLIHLASLLSGLSVFSAAKLVNCLAVIGCTTLVARSGGRLGAVLALPLAFAAPLEIFSYTWSEVPFIFFMLLAAVMLARVLEDREGRALAAPAILALACLGLFMLRYIGAYSLALMAIAGLVTIARRNWAALAVTVVSGTVAAALMAAYLLHNAELTGFATGVARIAPQEGHAERVAALLSALIGGTLLPVVVGGGGIQNPGPEPIAQMTSLVAAGQLVALIWLARHVRLRHPSARKALRVDGLALALLLTGGLYLAAMIVLRWQSAFDLFDFRLLGPGILLIMLASLRVALISWPKAVPGIAAFAGGAAALSLVFAWVQMFQQPTGGYAATVQAVESRYARVPPGAIVAYGDINLRYLRPDLFVAEPKCQPWSAEQESWTQFLAALDRQHSLMVDVSGHARYPSGCHRSVIEELSRHRAGELYLVP